jgi:hypothetical protein
MTSHNQIEAPMFGVAIDDRLDFCRDLVGSANHASAAQREQAASLKGVVFDGLVKAIEAGIPKSRSWVWADVDLGEGVHLRARAMSLASGVVIRPPIMSPSMLGYVDDTIKSARRLGAGAVLVATTYNPEADIKFRKVRQKLLRRIAGRCAKSEIRLFVELMPGLTRSRRAATQFETPDEYATRYLVEGMRQLQDASVDVSGWVVEPPLDPKAAAVIAGQARVDDRTDVSVMFRVSSDAKSTDSRLTADLTDLRTTRLAARSPGIDGIMVGPGAFVSELRRHTNRSLERATAVTLIAGSLGRVWHSFESAIQTSEVR